MAFEGAAESEYDFGKLALSVLGFVPSQIPDIPIGYWRSVGHSHTAFAIESFIDELAQKHGRNEVTLRRLALHKSPRAAAVLNKVVEISGYKSQTLAAEAQPATNKAKFPPAPNQAALGIARHSGWGSHVAMVAKVSILPNGDARVHKVWAVVDCGLTMQPDIVKQQIEGGIIFALSATLKQEINIENGQVKERNFYDTGDILRMHESPEIQVEIINQPAGVKPTGVGELGVPCVAPAVANAVANLCGKRVRRLPLTAGRIAAAIGILCMFSSSLLSLFPSVSLASGESTGSATQFTDAKSAFNYIFRVATSPRCANCHGTQINNRHFPTIGDKMAPHPMNIDSRFPELGGNCTTCHQKVNQLEPRLPPGAANNLMKDFLWQMPPASMILSDIKTPKQLCILWTNPTKNARIPGDRGSLESAQMRQKFKEKFDEHVDHDPLIHWAFQPGLGRTPSEGNKETLIAAMQLFTSWIVAGNNCEQL